MAATGLRTNHQSRVDWWRGQFQRQRKANLSVTEFCRQLGVSVTTFYYWKKHVHEALPNAPGRVPGERPSRHMTTAAGTTAANFVPVSILELAAGTALEIELTNACVTRLFCEIENLYFAAGDTFVDTGGEFHLPFRSRLAKIQGGPSPSRLPIGRT